MRILVTGASGFAGSALLPRLVAEGHDVRAFARDPARVSHDVPVVRGDMTTGEGLDEALDGVDVAYYLVHSMEASEDGVPFEERERRSAELYAEAAAAAGVRRSVYLGVMVDEDQPLSSHLQSRLVVERTVAAATPESIALRASIAIGPGSRSFRFLVHLVERLPVLLLPPWRRYRTQPIDERDVVAALLASAGTPAADGEHLSLDVAGPDVVSYGELLERIRDLMMVRRPSIGVPINSTPIFGRVASVLAGEDAELILPLMGGLQGDLLARDDRWATTLGVRPHGFDRAVNHALLQWERQEPLRAR
ncbi:NAD(P)H-binding protein [Patulibacter sp.]|uniref:NAD(P)H-binding protein n=1 Tax=Patulibacter sp. TaxID=1912859 RepID=UPI00271BC2E0|nr:NAD(P)H-binding protein [Patulibacter sp.]MDO9409209.1 NAD(P)H-binding protein [Patulibacter sp.]